MNDMAERRPDHDGLFASASQQAGYFTTAQARANGFSSALVTYHLKRGRFLRAARGVYRFRDYPSSSRESVMAAWLTLGRPAVVSHESALDILGLADLIPDAVHLTVPRNRRNAPRIGGVRVHTTMKPLGGDQVVVRDGIDVTAPARSIVDVAEAGSAPDQVVAAVRDALRRGLTTPEHLRIAIDAASSRARDLIQGAIPGPAAVRYGSPEGFRRALETRLGSISRDTGQSLTRLRKLVVFDRLVARLVTVGAGRWVLKGGVALDYRFGDRARTTRDIDFVVHGGEPGAIADLLLAQAADLQDFFTFAVERSTELADVDGADVIRFHVRAELAGRLFDAFVLDVGFDPPDETVEVSGPNLLEFAGLRSPVVPAIPLEVQVAEKVHAYTRTYGASGRPSTRVKDLIDMNLIATEAAVEGRRLHKALGITFARRATHAMPLRLPPPPASWRVPYAKLAREVGLPVALNLGFSRAAQFVDPVLEGPTADSTWNPHDSTWSPMRQGH